MTNKSQGVMERLYGEYETACNTLCKRIELIEKERAHYRSDSPRYRELYERTRRLKRYLGDTREWQDMIAAHLKAEGMSDAEILMLAE